MQTPQHKLEIVLYSRAKTGFIERIIAVALASGPSARIDNP
jgi:hypothetical protein